MKSFKKTLLGLFAISIIFNAQSQTGPGGTGRLDGTSSLELWLAADSLSTLNNGNTVNQWTDISGNGFHANNDSSYIFTANTPTFLDTISNSGKTIKAIRFDGDDFYDNGHSYAGKTVFIVHNIRGNLQGTDDLGQVWGSYADGIHVAYDTRAGNQDGFSFDGDGTPVTSGAYGFNSAVYGGAVTNGNSPAFTRDVWQILSVEFTTANTINRQVLGALYPNFGVASHNLDADIAEIIVFSSVLTAAERISIENYLSTKYNIDISASTNDHYAYDATHDGMVAGLGRVGAAYDTAGFSSKIFGLDTLGTTTVDDGDFIFFGHDSGSTSWTTTEEPTFGLSNIRRIAREWRVNETNVFGTVKVLIDTTELDTPPANYDRYVLLVDTDGDFTDASVYEMTQQAGTPYWETTYDFADGDYVSVGVVLPVIGFSTSPQSDFETVVAPTITVQTNFIVSSAISVDYTTSDNGATAGADYTAIATTTGNITLGNNSFTIPLTVTNDVASEPAESVNITLSNIPAGFTALNSPLVYTINDDDNLRKIYFSAASASVSEAASTFDFTVNITPSQADPGNATTVDYTVFGGTASGSGTDYTLAAGTLTIPINNIANTFSITITDDALSESTETVIVTLSNPTNGNLSLVEPVEFTLSITDNDPLPSVQFNTTTSSNDESVTSPTILVVLSTASGVDVTVDYTVTSTATGGGVDFTLISGTATITAGNIFTSISPTIVNDASPEADETITLTLASPSGASIGTNSTHIYTITNDDGPFGFTGPGGVGGASTFPLWLRADSISGLVDGASIASWDDISGNSNDATTPAPNVPASQPTYRSNQINGFPVVRFDGIDDFMDDARTYDAKTIFIVHRVSTTLQQNTDLGHIWGSYNELVQIAAEPRAGSFTNGYSFDGNQAGFGTARYAHDGQTYGGLVADGNSPLWAYDTPVIVTVEYDASESLTRQILGGLVDNFAVGDHHYGGDVAEIIVSDQEMSEARRNIIENYLSAKYGIALLGGNDFYAHQATHNNDLAGIGQDANGKAHTDAQSNNILRVNSPDGLANGEYLLYAHDNASLAWSSTESPADSIQRIAREWQIDETGDVGNIIIAIDTTYLTAKPTDFQKYVLLIDDNGDFSAVDGGTTIVELTQNGIYYETSSLNLSDDVFLSIGTIGITAQMTIASFSQSETTATYDIAVSLSRASASNTDITFAVDVASTATGGAVDYSIVASPITINAGLSSGTITITVTNDVATELDETVIVNIASTTNNVGIRVKSTFTLTIQDDDASGSTGTGPGGVRVPSDYAFWLEADTEVYNIDPPTALASNTDVVAYWEDQSTNANQAVDVVGVTAPNYLDNITDNQNGKPVLDFSGGNYVLTIADNASVNLDLSTQKTMIVAFKTGSDINSLQTVYEQGGGGNGLNIHIQSNNIYIAAWDNDWTGTYLDLSSSIAANTAYVAILEVDNGNTVIRGYLNAVLLGTTNILGGGNNNLDGHTGDVGIGGMNNQSYYNGGADTNDSGNYFTGQLLELMHIHNNNLNAAQRIIIENYLAGKWNINISTGNDIYAHKTTHSYGVAGIGQSAVGEFNLSAQSTGFVTISNPTGIDDNDYLIFGHDNADTSAYVTSEVPSADFERLTREWAISEQGDITGVKVTFDTTLIAANHGADFNEYALLVDADGDFSSGAMVYTMTQNGGVFEVSNVDFSNGQYFTFAAFKPTIQFVPATANGDESVSPVSVIAALNYPLSNAVTVDYALNVGNSTATRGGGADFDFADATFSIAAGDSTATLAITINDDLAIESSETIEIDLSNPSAGLFIANDTTYTYSITDNDITTQVDFSVSTSTIGEAAGTANITVKLNQLDGLDVDVVYTITAGSAAGSGTDYTLADGTATITNGNLTTNIQAVIVNDAALENAETIEITLTSPTNASLGSNTVHTLTITDDDTVPEVAFTSATSNGSEGSTPANITVGLSLVSGLDTTVDYEVIVANSTATGAGSDYTLADGSLTITAGNTTEVISISVVDDFDLEVDESIQLRLFDNGNLLNATVGAEDTLTFTINDNDASGFNGPGGVRAASDYVFWLRADKEVQNNVATNSIANDNQIAEGWIDYSGSNNDAIAIGGLEAIYKNNLSDNINQKPILDFSSGAEMNIANANAINLLGDYTNKTIAVAVNLASDVTTRQGIYEQGGGTNGFGMYVYQDSLFIAAWKNLGLGGPVYDTVSTPVSSGQTIIAILDYNTTSFTGYFNGSSLSSKVVSGGIPTHSGDITIGDIGDAPFHGSGGGAFLGDIMEMLSFNGNYNATQRIILENYLAGKYNIDISGSSNDYYAYQGTHSFDIAGLGRVGASDFKTLTQSDSMVTVSNASSMGDGEYFIFGHDNGSIATYLTVDVPAGIQRLEREWRVTKTGDVGLVTFSFDTTNIATSPSANYSERVLMMDADGDFSSGASFVTLTKNGSTYEANNVSFSDGDYFAFGIIRPELQFTLASSNNGEDTTPAQIEVSLNFPIGTDVSITVTQTGGTSTETTDYTFTDGTSTITAGNTTTTADIVIINDAEVESSETVILTLTAPTLGLLGTNTVHTYSISDDDNFRKANFVLSDSIDTEDQLIQGIGVFLNAADNTNPTEIYFSVTGGTALNDSIDYYVQAVDTLVFNPSETLKTIPINIIEDAIDENDETIIISLIGGSNATVGDTTVFTYTIQDNDTAPSVQFTSATKSGDESFQTVDLAVELSALSGKDITLSFSATGGTATDGPDFQINNTSIVIPAGATTDSLRFTVINDGTEEVPDETIIFTLADPSPNATLGVNSTLTYTILDNDGAGYQGPGGVGNLSTQTALWYRADDLNTGFTNGANVSSWKDQTNNTNDGFQLTASQQPIYNTNRINNRPAISFDGSDDAITLNDTDDINLGGPYDSKTIFIAFRTGADVTTRQMLYEEGGGIRGLSIYIFNGNLYIGGWNLVDDDAGATTPWPQTTPPFTVNVQRPVAANTNYFAVMQYDFDVAGGGFSGDVRAGLNGEVLQALTGAGRLFAHSGDIGIGSVVDGTVYHDNSNPSGPDVFTGDVAELYITNFVYNAAQRKISYNYLAAKYDINIGAEDIFAYEATHSYDVFGMGRTDAANTHTDAQGTGTLRINNPSDLGDNEFIIIGHDNGDISSWVSTEVPNNDTDNFTRITREWRADETGLVGNVSLTFTNPGFASPPAGFPENYILLVDTDGDFTSGAEVFQLSDIGGGNFSVNNIDLSGDKFFTIGLAKSNVEFTLATGNELEDNSPATIEVSLNYITSDAITVDYTVADVSATGGGVDYTVASGTLSFATGEQTKNLSVLLTNDALVENDETFTVTLSNPSGITTLGTTAVHTFTINDSDQTRKANLAAISATGAESVTSVTIDVFLSEKDLVNPTKVYYTVTGTATNGVGEDFNLTTPDSLLFTAPDTLATITIPIIDDAVDELDETIIITLTGGSNASLGDTLVYTYTIQDNDLGPNISFGSATSTGSEGSGTVSIPIQLSVASAQNVTIDYAVNVSSTATGGGGDYNLVGSTATIVAGQTTSSIDVTVVDDGNTEVDETIIIDLSNPVNATLIAPNQHTYTIIDNDGGFGPVGPGGVGKSSGGAELTYWLRADNSVYSDLAGTTLAVNGNDVFNWSDYINSHDATDATNHPVYTTGAVNGMPVIDFTRLNSDRFSMVNDLDINTSDYAQKSIVVVFRASTDVTTRQVIYEQGGVGNGLNIWLEAGVLNFGAWSTSSGWDYKSVTTPIAASDLVLATFELDQANSLIRAFGYVNGIAFTGSATGVTAVLNLHTGDIGIGAMVNGSRFLVGDATATGDNYYFDGDLLEIAHFNERNQNSMSRKLITSYYEGKYAFTAADVYDIYADAKDATHPNDIFGIGQDSVAARHLSARSTDNLLQIDNPVDVINGEYLLIGHDNASIAAYSNTEMFATLQPFVQRVDREWIVQESGDIGNFRFMMDTTLLPANPTGYEEYFLIVDNDQDGDFTDEINGSLKLYRMYDVLGNYVLSDTVNLVEGDIFTIGMAVNVAINNGPWDSASTWLLGVPQVGEPVSIAAASTVTLTTDITVSDLVVDVGGTLDLSTFKLTVTDSLTVNGTFSAGTGTIEYASSSGNVCVAPLTYYNIILSGSGTKTLCGDIIIQNDIQINNNPTFNTDGTNNYDIDLRGNWISAVAATFTANSGIISFTGTNPQTISKPGVVETFDRMVINKGSNNVTITDGGIAIADSLALVSGNLVLGNFNLQVNNAALEGITGGGATSYIQADGTGVVDRLITVTNTYALPVGDVDDYSPFTFTLNSGTVTTPRIQLNLTDAVHANLSGFGSYITRYWTLESTGLTSPNYDVVFQYTDGDVVGDEASLKAVKYNSEVLSTTSTLNQIANQISWGGITSFSDFTAGNSAALPITLLNFAVDESNGMVEIYWATASEINNDFFTIERSKNGVDFEAIEVILGAGDSDVKLTYSTIDTNPYSGVSYYRLKQTDFDGQFEYFDAKRVAIDISEPNKHFEIYPNPSNGNVIHLRSAVSYIAGEEVIFRFSDLSGKSAYQVKLLADENGKIDTEIYPNDRLSNGVYIVVGLSKYHYSTLVYVVKD